MGFPQGDVRLLESEVAQALLHSTVPARLGYVAVDGTPRVVPTWYTWTGQELVMATYTYCPPMGIHKPAHRVSALRANPAVAVTIDRDQQPPEVLLLRGSVEITEVAGMVPEQAEAARRFLGAEGGAGYVAQAEHPETRMARIALRPSWVGLLDFQSRLPDVIGGPSASGG